MRYSVSSRPAKSNEAERNLRSMALCATHHHQNPSRGQSSVPPIVLSTVSLDESKEVKIVFGTMIDLFLFGGRGRV